MFEPTKTTSHHQYEAFLRQLPADWEQHEIRKIGAVVGGGTPSREVPSFWQGSIPWVTPGEISRETSKLLYETREYISISGLAGSGAKLLPVGSLMVTTRATLGARAINTLPMTTNQGFKSIAFKAPEEASYYFHLFEKIKPELIRRASGTTFLEISSADFCSIKVPNPSREEKLLIAQILDTLDTSIHQTEAIIEKLKQVKQGLLHDLLTRGVDANGELRPSYEQAPELYQASPLGWIPKEWTIRLLGACADISSGVTLGRSVVGIGLLELPYLRVANVQDGYVDLTEIKTVGIFQSELERFTLKHGDVLMNEGGDYDKLGRGTVWRAQIEPCLHQNHVFRVRCNIEILLPDYLSAYSSSQRGKVFFIQSSKQSTNLASINSTQLKAFPIAFPDLSEQNKIIKKYLFSNARIMREENGLQKLKKLKSALMDDLLTGRVRVTPLLMP